MSARPFSFEFFPPKTPEGIEKLRATRQQLAQFNPEFFSVTFGAGGTTRDGTLQTVLEIRGEGFAAAPHLSCIASTRENIRDIVQQYREHVFATLLPCVVICHLAWPWRVNFAMPMN